MRPAFLRLFVAIDPGGAVRSRLAAVQETLRRTDAHVAWVPPGNLHLSLLFLGDVPAERLPLAADSLRESLAGVSGFVLRAAGVGFFGRPASPRVIWAGIEEHAALAEAQRRVREAMGILDLSLEDRPYVPHVTLGRVRSGRGRTRLLAELEAHRDAVFGEFAVDRIALMRSTLASRGARYDVEADAPLAGPV